nr:ice-structuring glycoprotein-like isoform X2 [Aedes albopictus]
MDEKTLGRCNREKPPCKYFHPPQHLKDQLLINGRNHLALKNAIMQQMGISPGQPVLPGQVPAVNGATTTAVATAGVPPGAAAAALGFTISWGGHPHHPAPYTTYVLSHHHTNNGSSCVPAIMNGIPSPISNGCPSQSSSSTNNNNNSHHHTSNTTCNTSPNHNNNNNNNNHISTNNNNSQGGACKATNPYLASMPTSTYSPYFPPGHLMPTLLGPADPSAVSQVGPVVQQTLVPATQQKIPRSDRLETAPVSAAAAVAAAAAAAAATMGTLPPPPPPAAGAAVSSTPLPLGQSPLEAGKKRAADSDMIQMMDMKTMGSFYYENFAFPGMVPYKRTAADKSGIPVYQPGATTYQQLMQLQQPFVPVSCEYPTPSPSATSATYVPQTSTATLIANTSSSNSAQSTILTNSSYYTSSGNSVNINNNNSKVNNKNTTLVKSLSLQSVSSIGTGLGHLANGQMHSDNDLSSVKSEPHLSDKDDPTLSEANNNALLTSPTTSTSSSQSQTLVSSAATTQSVPVPITSAMLQSYSTAAHINSYNTAAGLATLQAQAQSYAAQAAAVAQANQAAAASAQYTAHYTDAANLAKEVAQKNYANALKMAAASNALTGKPLTALSYTGVALNKTGVLPQTPSYAAAAAVASPAAAPSYPPPRISTPAVAMAAATPQQTMLPAITRPPPPILPQAAFAQMLRPQMPANFQNPYAAAFAAQHQLFNPSLMYPSFPAGGYQFTAPMHAAMPATNLTAIPQVQQVPTPGATPGSAVVLNPYKKMKTS